MDYPQTKFSTNYNTLFKLDACKVAYTRFNVSELKSDTTRGTNQLVKQT